MIGPDILSSDPSAAFAWGRLTTLTETSLNWRTSIWTETRSGIEGYHKKISRFDKGHEVRTEYRDEGGRLTVGPDGGYAAVERTFDAHGNELRTTYIGIDDHPVFDRSKGYAIKTTAFDACGRETKSAFFDENERPVRSKEGYVHIRKTYDEANNVVEEAYLDERLQPIRLVAGYASVTREFDRNRNLVDERYFDEQGNALLTKDGFSEHVTRYNDHNALVEEAFLGAKGELVLNKKNGWAKRVRRYDGNNGLIEEAYFGAADEPALNADGYARAAYVNDAHGHETEVAVLWARRKAGDRQGRLREANQWPQCRRWSCREIVFGCTRNAGSERWWICARDDRLGRVWESYRVGLLRHSKRARYWNH